MTPLSVGLSLMLAALHVFAGRLHFFEGIPRSRLLSAAGGISAAYVFVQLLPELAEASDAVGEEVAVDAPVYLLALLGLVIFYVVERMSARRRRAGAEHGASAVTWFSFTSYAVYNGVIGYVLVREHEHLTAVLFFAVAMGVHFIVNDHALREHHGHAYHRVGRWIIAAAVLVGAGIGAVTHVHEAAIGTLLAFIAGGLILNVLKEELPEERESSLTAFVAGAAVYSLLLLAI